MSWAMEDEAIKVQLFRFVDVLPMLHTDDQLIEHLLEYLEEVRERMPYSIRVALGVARRAAFTRSAVARAARLSVMDFARRFMAGSNTQEVLAAAERERKLKRAFTLDILGEAGLIEHVHDRYGILPQPKYPWPGVSGGDRGYRLAKKLQDYLFQKSLDASKQ